MHFRKFMKAAVTPIIGVILLLLAITSGLFNFAPDLYSKDSGVSKIKPTRTVSSHGEERRSMNRRARDRDPESEFLKHLSKIKPTTDFEDPSDGYFKGYLLSRNAERLLEQGEQASDRKAILGLLEKSYACFLGVRETAPDWKDQMVSARLDKTKSSLKEAYLASFAEK